MQRAGSAEGGSPCQLVDMPNETLIERIDDLFPQHDSPLTKSALDASGLV